MTNIEATNKAHILLINMTYDELALKLGITKPTLYVRLVKHNWKLGEIVLLERM